MDEQQDRPVVATVIGESSPANGITIATGPIGGPFGTLTIEYPMAIVDPSSVALIRELRMRA